MRSRSRSTKSIRRLGAALAVLGALIAGLWLWPDMQRQNQVLGSVLLGLVAILWLLAWTALSPALSRGVRAAALVVAAVGVGFLAASFRFVGFTGDLLPLFVPRWERPPSRVVDAASSAPSADFPQFLGSARQGVVRGVSLARDWGAQPPSELWRRPIGEAWSGFAVVGERAVTLEQRPDGERVTALELRSGEELWSAVLDPEPYRTPLGGNGPRSTPTVIEGVVYTTSSRGWLHAHELASGAVLWSRDALRENGGVTPEWGFAGSPLVLDEVVVVNAGGAAGRSLVAYDRATGERRWSGGDAPAGYASPLLVELAGVSQIVVFGADRLSGHDPASGSVLWSHPWPSAQPNVTQPLVIGGDLLLASAGYGVGSELLRFSAGNTGLAVAGLTVESAWRTTNLKSKISNVVAYEGFLYGLDEGIMVCLDAATGERAWKAGRFGHGQLLLVGDLLLIQAERGEVFLVEPDPSELRELGSFRALPRKAWNTMALAGSLLLVRNHEEAAAFELPLASPLT